MKCSLSLLAVITGVCVTLGVKHSLRSGRTFGNISCEFPYAVVLCFEYYNTLEKTVTFMRGCFGSIIADQWVVTAGRCIQEKPNLNLNKIQYGDLTITSKDSPAASFTDILKKISHPAYRHVNSHNKVMMLNDIGLLHIKRISLKSYGKISAVDYFSLIGLSMHFLTYDETVKNFRSDVVKNFKIGEAIVVSCESKQRDAQVWGPAICIAPKCGKRKLLPQQLDSGAPLVHAGQIVGIYSGGISELDKRYTPLSPYLEWINSMMNPSQHVILVTGPPGTTRTTMENTKNITEQTIIEQNTVT